jgi:hypothetical protein
MKLLLFTALMAAVFYIAPGVLSDAGSPCGAVVNRAITIHPPANDDGQTNPMAIGMIRLIGPTVARKAIESRYPSVPPEISCAYLWWRSFIDTRALSFGQ